MSAQKTRARAAWKGSGDTPVPEVYGRIAAGRQTTFRGYEALEFEARDRGAALKAARRSEPRAGDESN